MMTQRYAVIGAGLMGVGIALCFARAGKAVLLVDTDPQRLAAIPGTAREILDELAEAGQFPAEKTDAALALLAGTQRLADIAACGLVIEAIPERLPLKHALYGELEAILPPDALIASNTSGLTPDSLAEHMQHPERLLIAHFWHPPHFIPLVEIVPGSATDERHMASVQQLLTAMGLEAVRLNRAAPGFIGNRLQFAILREALHIVDSGIASPEVVDQVMRASLGRRYGMVGPLEAADMTGLETVADICRHLLPTLATGGEMMRLVEEKVAQGNTGQRSGEGFYRWDEARRERIRRRRAWQLRHALKP
ncbi:3-hydroxyacyl-CoA dehydrogenase family protein [Pluralibacter gergoviae]|uniref:3-hydroxyacyl-CoA dehydrogenase family protein n=1 Tax=Pluralibacter gergoviae TaxID=61647 RepID=UPI0008DBFD4F|nr:3-hydroxyacyl-CoA dehydrogenase family protein [Pluralibacter gergoviae]EKW6619492.1 3-hydroxyacyl-CoA dehydrogenase family protein [Pluralibacter gergoviae]OHY69628.1 3-hydroxybutyryl-CoA dehydrogenase [Pluralibacter gergoviae]